MLLNLSIHPSSLILLSCILNGAIALTKEFNTSDDVSYTHDYIPASDSQSTVLFIHGFPSGRGDWHHQVDNLTAAGYDIIAPDCLGYGGTDKPLDVERYNFKTIAGHFNELLDNESSETVVGIGHDWGCVLLSIAAVYYPDRFEKLVFLSVAYEPPCPFDIDAINAEALEEVGYTRNGYWYLFNAFDAAEVLGSHLQSFFSLAFPVQPSIWRENLCMLGGARAWVTSDIVTALPTYLTEADKDGWLERFAMETDLAVPLNYYKSRFAGVQVADEANVSMDAKALDVPVMTIVGADDAAESADNIQAATKLWTREKYRAEVVQGAGHWVMLEQPEEVNRLLSALVAS